MRCVAILETMWGRRGNGTNLAPRFFKINPENHSGRRLYQLVGPGASLTVTNACRELVENARQHGTPDPAWLAANLRFLDGNDKVREAAIAGTSIQITTLPPPRIDILLVCGKVAQATYKQCGYTPVRARVIDIPHPAARGYWNRDTIEATTRLIQGAAAA